MVSVQMHGYKTMCGGQSSVVPESQDGNTLWEKSKISNTTHCFHMTSLSEMAVK